MTLSKVIGKKESGEQLELPLRSYLGGFYIEDITGLDPVKAEITSSSFGTVDGEEYQASRRGKRNIVMKLGFAPDYVVNSVYSLRQSLYSVFAPENTVQLDFVLDNGTTVYIKGLVESCDVPIFTKTPEANISILCFKPDFINNTPSSQTGLTLSASAPIESISATIDYIGTSPAGFLYRQQFGATVPSDLRLMLASSAGSSFIDIVDYSFVNGDLLEISTIPGSKGVWVTRNTVRSSILYNVDPESSYGMLSKGPNIFRIVTDLYTGLSFEIGYQVKYGGL